MLSQRHRAKFFLSALIAYFLVLSGCTSIQPGATSGAPASITLSTATPIVDLPKITTIPESAPIQHNLVEFNDMAIVSNDEMWAVGQHGIIIHDYPQERNLVKDYDYPGQYYFVNGWLDNLEFTSPENGWVVGYCGQLFHWDGRSWTEVISRNLDDCSTFTDLEFASKDDGWLCGMEGSHSRAILYHWNGVNWKELSLKSEIGRDDFRLEAIDINSYADVWAAGYSPTGNPSKGVVLQWNGVAWKEIPTLGSMDNLIGISGTSPEDVWAVNNKAVFHWDGVRWNSTTLAEHKSSYNSDLTIKAIAPDNVWIGGYDILAHWNGTAWEFIRYTEILDIVDIDVSPKGTVWALTRTGSMFRLEK